MKYKSVSLPAPSKGTEAKGPELVAPNQALSLRQILERFTRNQAVPVGRDHSYDEGEDDLEKVAHMDLVDKAEFVEKLKQTQKDFEKQEKAKAAAQRKKLEDEERQKIAEELKKAESPPKKAE